MHTIRLTVNGVPVERAVRPNLLLSDFIRHELGLTGTHVGCEHGVCGACTILINGRSARSCLIFAVQADGQELTTIEGLAKDGELHPLQQAFIDNHALQCGFCTPGMILSACELLEQCPQPDAATVRTHLSGNLCRCTGYHGIIAAVLQVAQASGPRGDADG